MNTNTENKNNKNLMATIIIVAVLVVIVAAIIVVYKVIENRRNTGVMIESNITLMKCNTGKILNDSDLAETEEILRGIIGGKFMSIEKKQGTEPVLGYPTNENGEEIKVDIGDGLLITFKVLDENEKIDVMTAIANKFNFIHDYDFEFEHAVYQVEFNDIARSDTNN